MTDERLSRKLATEPDRARRKLLTLLATSVDVPPQPGLLEPIIAIIIFLLLMYWLFGG